MRNRFRGFLKASICVVLCIGVLGAVAACKKTPEQPDAPRSPGLSLIEGHAINEDGVAVRTEHYTVTEGMLAYYFYSYGLAVMQQMETKATYDSSRTLHEQMYTETESWYDAIMNAVLERVCRMMVYCEGAYDAGKAELPEDVLQEIEKSVYTMRYSAAALYQEDLTTYLRRYYGPKITEEDLYALLRMEAVAGRYSGALNAELEAAITAEEALSYATAHNLSDEGLSRNIAYLTVSGSATDDVNQNVTEARKAILKNPTKETIEGLTAYGTPSAEDNLIYENTGISAIRDWLFAEERKVGDVGVVNDTDATYVLLYTGNGVSRGEMLARMAIFDVRYAEWYNGLVGKLNFGYNYDIIDSYDVE